jgi:uncharacterized membrane protein YjgN (DUF898 family)
MVIGIYIFAFVLIFAAVIYRFTFGLRKRTGQTSQTQFVMLTLIGLAMLLLSATSLINIALSKRVSASGYITRHRVSTGKNASTSFVLLPENGNSVWLTCSYTGAALFDGERVNVEYRDRTGDITKIQVLDGSRAGWSETESGGLFQPLLILPLGVFLLWMAYKAYRHKVHEVSHHAPLKDHDTASD